MRSKNDLGRIIMRLSESRYGIQNYHVRYLSIFLEVQLSFICYYCIVNVTLRLKRIKRISILIFKDFALCDIIPRLSCKFLLSM